MKSNLSLVFFTVSLRLFCQQQIGLELFSHSVDLEDECVHRLEVLSRCFLLFHLIKKEIRKATSFFTTSSLLKLCQNEEEDRVDETNMEKLLFLSEFRNKISVNNQTGEK